MKTSVIILTKNAGEEFSVTLDAVFAQREVGEPEVMVVDSGSSDGTLDICRKFPVKLLQIPADEFQHGRTRNYGARAASGEILVFLVQDAIPVGPHWLRDLIAPLLMDEKAAGAYSRNCARPQSSERQRREIERYFPPVDRVQTRSGDHTFSNVSSAVRRDVLEKIPFPSVAFGEDQLWAREVLEAGYSIHYASSSVVLHSHQEGVGSAFDRGYLEGRHASSMGQGGWHTSGFVVVAEMLFQVLKWGARLDVKSCWYSVTMAAWHFGFRKGFGTGND